MPDETSTQAPAEQALGTPTVGSTPVPLDPNGMYILPGVETPLKGEQLRNGLLMQADYTRGQQKLARDVQEVEAIRQQAQDALYMAGLLNEDFDSAVEQLRPIFKPESAQPQQYAGQGQQQNGNGNQALANLPPEVLQALQQVPALQQEIERLRAETYGYMANSHLTSEMSQVETRHPDFKDNIELRGRVIRRAGELRIPIEDAYRVETYDLRAQEAANARAEQEAIAWRRIIPSLGASSRDVSQVPVDSDELFLKVFKENAKAQGWLEGSS